MKRTSEWTITRRELLAMAATLPAMAASEEARTTPLRRRDSFDFDWKFFKGDAPGAQSPAFNDHSWRTLDLPHDWSIEGPFDEHEPTAVQAATCPPASAGTGSGFALPKATAPRKYRSNSMAYIRTAKFGSMAIT